MAAKVNKKLLKLYIVCLLLMATNTIGFDVYFHSISVSSLDLIAYYNPVWSISGYELPRYILLHYFLWTLTLFGCLPLVPVLAFIYANLFYLVIGWQFKHVTVKYFLVTFLLVNVVFTSALGLSISLILVGLLLKDNGFRAISFIVAGSLFHPIGFIVGFIVLLLLKRWKALALLLLLFYSSHLYVTYFSTGLSGPPRSFLLHEILEPDSFIGERTAIKLSREIFFALTVFALANVIAFLARAKEFKSVIASMNRLLISIRLKVVIYFFAVIVSVISFRSQVATGGPIAVAMFQSDGFSPETLSIINSAWISPLLLDESVKRNQYYFRGDSLK